MISQAQVTIRPAESGDEPRWDEFALGHPGAEKYHLYGWRRVIERSFGHPTHYLLAEAAGRVAGLLPLAQVKSRLFGNFLVSLPFFNYGGILANTFEVEQALFERALGLARELKADRLELRHLAPLAWFAALSPNGSGGHYETRGHKVSMRLALPETAEALWGSLKSKLRSQVRRPTKEGCTARVGGPEMLEDFYLVFAENMRDLGTPVYGKGLFESVLAEYPDSARVAAVYLGAQPVAAGLVVGFKDILEVPWASSLRRYSRLAPNMLLYWTMIEHACQAGYRRFDFGRSTEEASTHRFKEQWGARAAHLSWHTWSAARGGGAEATPENPKFALAIKLWQHLPLALANALGPRLVRCIP